MNLKNYIETRGKLISQLQNLWLEEFVLGEFYVLMEAGRLRSAIKDMDEEHLKRCEISQKELNEDG